MPDSSLPRALAEMPEAFVSNAAIAGAVSRAVRAGTLRRLASRLYAGNLNDAPEAIVRRNLWSIVTGYFPGALIADRTGLENAPAADGSVCLVAAAGRDIALPGCILRPRRGAPPLPTDRPFLDGLFLSSTARAYVENMRPSRGRGGRLARTLSRREIEERLDALIRRSGEDAANRLRAEIREAGAALGLQDEAAALDSLIGALLGTRDAPLRAPAARARRRGRPFDPDRMALFETLCAALRAGSPAPRPEPGRGAESRAVLAFYEAYFSNFIEGTEFTVEEAARIVFNGELPRAHTQDAHDVLGTWRIVSDERAMREVAGSAAAFERLLKARHAAIMEGRPELRPGAFKLRANRAGGTVFVDPDLVAGTLEQGFGLCRSLETPFQRAVFVMFLVADVHPFADGNGRVARAAMNAELSAAGEERIVIPTVFRNNYIAALKALSRGGAPRPLIRVLAHAQRWTSAAPWRSVEETRRALESYNAFLDPDEADAEGLRLLMPNEA